MLVISLLALAGSSFPPTLFGLWVSAFVLPAILRPAGVLGRSAPVRPLRRLVGPCRTSGKRALRQRISFAPQDSGSAISGSRTLVLCLPPPRPCTSGSVWGTGVPASTARVSLVWRVVWVWVWGGSWSESSAAQRLCLLPAQSLHSCATFLNPESHSGRPTPGSPAAGSSASAGLPRRTTSRTSCISWGKGVGRSHACDCSTSRWRWASR